MVSADSACAAVGFKAEKVSSQIKPGYVSAAIAQHAKRPHCAADNFVKAVGWLLLAEYLNVAAVSVLVRLRVTEPKLAKKNGAWNAQTRW